MFGDWYLLVPVLLPLLSGLLLTLYKPLGEGKNRNPVTLAVLCLNVAALLPVLLGGERTLTLFTLSDSLPVLLRVDDTGRWFSAIMAFVWAAAGAYSFEYMAKEEHLRRYYGFYLMTLGVLMALCFAGTIVTFYMFYEAMTLLTFPLVLHTMKRDAVAAGVKYLIYSVVGASLALLGILVLSPYVTSFDFVAGGVLNLEAVAGREGLVLAIAFVMLLGMGTEAGVLGCLRLLYCFIGVDFLRGTWVQTAFMSLTLFTVFMGSLLAYQEGGLKKRLAYSSVSQVSYVLFGLSTMHPIGFVGAMLHVLCHALVKDTLFMSAGAIISKTGKTQVSDLEGIGKQMPVTMWCFTLASVGLVGIPPALGFVSKWYLAQGALEMTGVAAFFSWFAPMVLLLSALLTAGYLFPISIRGFLPGRNADGSLKFFDKCEPTHVMLIPLVILTALSLLAGMFPAQLTAFLTDLASTLM